MFSLSFHYFPLPFLDFSFLLFPLICFSFKTIKIFHLKTSFTPMVFKCKTTFVKFVRCISGTVSSSITSSKTSLRKIWWSSHVVATSYPAEIRTWVQGWCSWINNTNMKHGEECECFIVVSKHVSSHDLLLSCLFELFLVNCSIKSFQPRGSPLTSKRCLALDRVK